MSFSVTLDWLKEVTAKKMDMSVSFYFMSESSYSSYSVIGTWVIGQRYIFIDSHNELHVRQK